MKVNKLLTIIVTISLIFSMISMQNVCAETINQEKSNVFSVQGEQQNITIKVTLDNASEKLLSNADKCIMYISDGHDEIAAEKIDGVWQATLPKGEENNLTIGFAINRAYFIPTIKVNGKPMETFSWPTEDEQTTNIGISIPMSEVGDGVFKLDLTFGKTANLDPEWLKLVSGINNMDVSYMVSEEGNEIISDDTDVTFKAKDSDADKLVSDAVATYDFSILMDNTAQSELAKPVDITLELDENKFTEKDYVVVRNHNGKREIIESEYRDDEHVLSFSSDKFSTYTIAKAGAKILSDDSLKSASKGVKTGDMSSAMLLVLLAISIASIVFAKSKRNKK